ncbi:MAG: competence/damage-inducible protein A [Phycisphaeraceae bacterium]|nr:competence/damage-inducible protein A [Phycisphaeraceae bacterium]
MARGPHRTVAILSVGDELVLGQTRDTNSQWLAGRLLAHGVTAREFACVPDDARAIAEALGRLACHADLIAVTGGLGPTEDDLTRRALALAMDDSLIEDAAALEQIRRYFQGRGRTMPEANRVQALRPTRAEVLPNSRGTAPGLYAMLPSEAEVCCLPGPPHEMRDMVERCLIPRLRPDPSRVVRTLAIHTFGLGESEVARRLGDLMARDATPLVGTTASLGVVSCRVRYEGPTEHADRVMRETRDAIRERVGDAAFGDADQTLASVVISLLKNAGTTVATVESCTGGLLGESLTEIAGASAVYLGGWVTYSNKMKASQVGVPAEILDRFGAVSRECARAMAVGGLAGSGANHVLAITGVAGPDGGTTQRPVGTVWIALASEGASLDVRRFVLPGDRRTIRAWSALSALALLRLRLLGIDMELLGQMER